MTDERLLNLPYEIDELIQKGDNLKTDFFVVNGFLETADVTHIFSSLGKIKWETWYDGDGQSDHKRENFLANHVHIFYIINGEEVNISLKNIDSIEEVKFHKDELIKAVNDLKGLLGEAND